MDETYIPLEEVIAKLIAQLKEEGSILFAQIPGRLNPIDYRQYSGKQGLKAWLLSFPEFTESANGQALELAASALPNEAEDAGAGYSLWEPKCMHAFAYMNYWNQNLKQLRTLGDFPELKVDTLRDRIAHTLMHDLFSGALSMDLSDPKMPRLFLNTDLTLPTGHPLYAVLVPNPANTNGSKQFWVMKGFGSTSEADRSELGDWLRAYFGCAASLDYAELTQRMDAVISSMEQLREQTAAFLTGLDGQACPELEAGRRLSEKLAGYEAQWQKLLQTVDGIIPLPKDTPVTLAQLRAVTDKESLRASFLSQALEAFDAMAQGLHNYFQGVGWARDTSSPLQDLQQLRGLLSGNVSDSAPDEFRALLGIYRHMRDALAAQRADDAFYAHLEAAQAHFKEIPSMYYAPRVLLDTPPEAQTFLADIDQIEQFLTQYQVSQDTPKTSLPELPLPETSAALLTAALERTADYQRNWLSYLMTALPREEALQALVIPEAEPFQELTCYAAAMRLLAAGAAREGEQYLILGLQHEAARCAPALLKLYRENNRVEDFEAVWQTFHDTVSFSPEDEFFWFGVISVRSPEQALNMARANMKLQYQSAYLTHLITAAQALGDAQLADTFRSRLEKLEASSHPDAFETALLSGDAAAIGEAAREETLRELGFTDQQIKSICATAESGEYPTGDSAYETGCRCFRFQGNRNGLAERWMWQGISKQARFSYGELLCLLTMEHRWEEVIALYEANADVQKRFEVSRRFYLIARFRSSVRDAAAPFSENLQDVLLLMNLQTDFQTEFAEAAQLPGQEFYASLQKLYGAVSHPYLWSVVFEDRSLREWVSDPLQMEQLGLDAARIGEMYRSGKYPHGTDAAGISARLQALAGNLNGAAEAAALLAPEDASADLLWSIYSAEENESAMYDLLVRHPRLQKAHSREYTDFLYARGEYAAFLEALSPDDTLSDQLLLQRAVAQLRTRQPLSDSPAICAEAARNGSEELCLALLTAAAEQKETQLVNATVCACFENWLSLESQQLAELIRCGGYADEAMLEGLQAAALEEGTVSLAVYLQNNLHIGNIPQEAEALFLRLQRELETVDPEKWPSYLQMLQRLYPDREELLSVRSISISIGALLQDTDPANRKDNARRLHTILQALGDETALFDTVTELLSASEYCWDFRIYTTLWEYGQRMNRATDVLLLLHGAAGIPGGEKKPLFRDYLIKLYQNALIDGTFPLKIAGDAEQLCFQALAQGSSAPAAVCIYLLEQLSRRPIYANAVLNHLILGENAPAESPRQALEQLGITQLPAELELPQVPDTSLDLFEKLLESSTEEQILEYLQFCKSFVRVDTASLQELRNVTEQQQMLSEQQSILALDLLCSAPENAEYWEICTHIPFDTGDAGHLRFMHLCCQRCSGHWEEYVLLCEEQDNAPQLLAPALAAWAGVPDSDQQKCRQYIEDHLKADPDYLSHLEDAGSLCQLITHLCLSLKGDTQEWKHAHIGTVAFIAVSAGQPECLRILMRDAGHLLLGSKADLGVVVVSRLLLAGRVEEAMQWITPLSAPQVLLNYSTLIGNLKQMDEAQLRDWSAQPDNIALLELTLPDGNLPNREQISALATDALLDGKAQETATFLAKLQDIIPVDYVIFYSLMELCKTGFEGSLPLLHWSLVNLVRLPDPVGKTRFYYDRSRDSHAAALAILNQLIIARGEMDLIQDGWNFQLSTVRNLEIAGIDIPDRDMLDDVEKAFRDSLSHNPPEEERNLRLEAWMANITGNWTEYLRHAFDSRDVNVKTFIPADTVSSTGLLRSVLWLLHNTDSPELVDWLNALELGSNTRIQQLKTALYLKNRGILDQFYALEGVDADELLRFPCETHSLLQNLIEKKLTPFLDQDVIYAETLAHILCAVGGNSAVFGQVRALARNYFDKGQDDMAFCFYSALHAISARLNVTHSSTANVNNSLFAKNREEYQARMRISGAFSGQPEMLQKLSSPTLSPWSAINLVLSLAIDDAARIDEIKRLRQYLAPGRSELLQKVQILLTQTVPDQDKLAIIKDPDIPEMDRYYLSRLLLYPYRPKSPKRSQLLGSVQSTATAFSTNNLIFKALDSKHKQPTQIQKTLILFDFNLVCVNKKISQQKNVSLWPMPETVSPEKPRHIYVAPSYVAALTPIPGTPEELRELLQRYHQIVTDSPNGRHDDKAALSQEIYRRRLAFEDNDTLRFRSMVQYSVDRFYLLLSEGDPNTAVSLLIPLLEQDSIGIQSCAELNAMATMFNSIGAKTLLRSYADIRSMVQDYADHKSAFTKLLNTLRDSVAVRDLGAVYEGLDRLTESYTLSTNPDIDHSLQALEEADRKISSISGANWRDIRSHLQRLIRNERALLFRRAILNVSLENTGEQGRKGHLHGIVTNKGIMAADDLILQAFYGDPNGSSQYALEKISPNGKTIFEIPYSLPPEAQALTGYLDLVGRSNGEIISVRKEFSLPLGECSGDSLLYNTYNTNKPGHFVYDPETGTVKNDHFFGRSKETSQMRELVAGDSFSDYHSAIVYGVRRTGKTSLLEYFRTYVRGARPECLCIRVDVQSTDETIQGVFVDSVLSEDTIQAALEASGDKDVFMETWMRPFQSDEDLKPSMLKRFFKELNKVTGKGLILIIDEIDRLFKRLIDHHMESSLDELLKTISGILDDADTHEYLHLVMCGSNWLMHYASIGKGTARMQQFFHRLGDYTISVGRLPKEDVMDLLLSADVNFTQEALELIWAYTGGLVWFVKLFANAAIRRAKEHNRSRIYPADVFFSLHGVLSEQNCEQFYEGCTVNGMERLMIDAMQALAYRQDERVPLERISELMGKPIEDVERALSGLERFDIARRDPVKPNMVHFTLDIYRRYFRTVSTVHTRIPEEPTVFERKIQSNPVIQPGYGDDEII